MNFILFQLEKSWRIEDHESYHGSHKASQRTNAGFKICWNFSSTTPKTKTKFLFPFWRDVEKRGAVKGSARIELMARTEFEVLHVRPYVHRIPRGSPKVGL